MAIFRKIHTSFWSDSFTSELNKEQKLFYLYILTNEKTRQCGVYEITKKQIAYDLGCTIDTVSEQLQYFIKQRKIKFNDSTNELAIGNWLKYNSSTSPKVKSCIDKEFGLVKDTVLIQYVKSMGTHPQEEEEQEEEEEEEEQEEEEEDSILIESKIQEIKNSERWLQDRARIEKIPIEKTTELLNHFLDDQKNKDEIEHRDLKEIKNHFANWLTINKNKDAKQFTGKKESTISKLHNW